MPRSYQPTPLLNYIPLLPSLPSSPIVSIPKALPEASLLNSHLVLPEVWLQGDLAQWWDQGLDLQGPQQGEAQAQETQGHGSG